MKDTMDRIDVFRQLDNVVGNVGSVIFGSTGLSTLPVSELVNFFGLNLSVCNRSIEELTPESALSHLDECVLMLHPRKLFLGFGDEFLQHRAHDLDEYISSYKKLIRRIAENSSCEIYVLSPVSDLPDAALLGARLKQMAADMGCRYIDAMDCISSDLPMLRLFRRLSHYVRDSRISFCEAMELAGNAI